MPIAVVIVLAAAAAAGTGMVQAQGGQVPAPTGVAVVNGPNLGEAIISWDAVAGVSSYQVGWLAVDDFTARRANEEWRSYFRYSNVTADSSWAVDHLTPGREYYFIVGRRHATGTAWSAWETLRLNADTAAGPALPPTTSPVSYDYDADDDGLIEVSNLAQLDAIRADLDGDGKSPATRYAAAFPDGTPMMGCPDVCRGYELIADLDFDANGNGTADAGDAYWNDGAGWLPIGERNHAFSAVFDGGGHTISNLYINRSDAVDVGLFGLVAACGAGDYIISCGGLFGYAAPAGAIRRVGLVSVDVRGRGSVGGLVGYNAETIVESYVSGRVSGQFGRVGGLAGVNNGAVVASYSDADVTGSGEGVGGLVGSNGGFITASYAAGSVSGGEATGGLAGTNDGTIAAGYATGDVSGKRAVGGLLGHNDYGHVIAAYAKGSVSGEDSVGGMAGWVGGGSVIASHAMGSVSGGDGIGGLAGGNFGAVGGGYAVGSVSGSDQVGGLAGSNFGSITASYATGDVVGEGSDIGGLAGRNDSRQLCLDTCGAIIASYALGLVSTASDTFYIGGLIGWSTEGAISNSYWDLSTSGQPGSYGGVGKTTAELQWDAHRLHRYLRCLERGRRWRRHQR